MFCAGSSRCEQGETIIQKDDGVTPTPVISHAILMYNRTRKRCLGGRNCHHTFPQSSRRRWFQVQPAERRPCGYGGHRLDTGSGKRSVASRQCEVKRISYEKAIKASSTREEDLALPYVRDLKNVVDMDAIRDAGLRLAVDPLGGAALRYWEPINSIYDWISRS